MRATDCSPVATDGRAAPTGRGAGRGHAAVRAPPTAPLRPPPGGRHGRGHAARAAMPPWAHPRRFPCGHGRTGGTDGARAWARACRRRRATGVSPAATAGRAAPVAGATTTAAAQRPASPAARRGLRCRPPQSLGIARLGKSLQQGSRVHALLGRWLIPGSSWCRGNTIGYTLISHHALQRTHPFGTMASVSGGHEVQPPL
jgi:hypothetical protein